MKIADSVVWRAELTIGRKEGYEGPEVIEPQMVIAPIQRFQAEQARWFPSVVWEAGTVVTPGYVEGVFRVALESNPQRSPDATEAEITDYATQLALYLAEAFHQAQIYVAIYRIRGMIVQAE